MRKILIVLLSFLMCSVGMHVQSLGSCVVEESDEFVYYKFELSHDNIKLMHPSLANFKGAVKDMLLFENLIDENLKVSLNNKPVKLNLYKTHNDKRFLKLVYKSKKEAEIRSIVIKNNNFILFKDNHASFDFWLKIKNQKRLFKLKTNHKTIKANY